MKNKYDFDDIVIVVGKKKSLDRIRNKGGIIQGMVQDEVTTEWVYAVEVPNDNGIVWSIYESDLMPTNEKSDPDQSQSVGSIRVQVDPNTGEGRVVDDK